MRSQPITSHVDCGLQLKFTKFARYGFVLWNKDTREQRVHSCWVAKGQYFQEGFQLPLKTGTAGLQMKMATERARRKRVSLSNLCNMLHPADSEGPKGRGGLEGTLSAHGSAK